MNKFLVAGLSMLAFTSLRAQEQKGKVTYERVSQIQIQLNDSHGIENQMPRTRTDKFELLFGDDRSLWRSAGPENDENTMSGEGGMQIRMMVIGTDDVLYTNFTSGKRVEKREFFDKNFIIDDSIRKYKWKMTGETKQILNRNCMKATASDIRTRMQMNMENGVMQRKEIQDTVQIIAWFTSEIPVPAGPAEYQGQLPGLILELDISNGRQTYRAVQIESKVDLSDIKEPEGKKHYTPEEFRKEREKMLQEMQRNNRGGNQVIRMN